MLVLFNNGYERNYSVPAGHMNGGESVKSAMIREAEEECSIRIAPQDLEVWVVGVMHRLEDDERIDFLLVNTGHRHGTPRFQGQFWSLGRHH